MGIWKSDDNYFSFTTGNGLFHDLKSNTPVQINIWRHIAVVWDGSKKSIYVDGVLENSSIPLDNRKPCSGASNLNIARRSNNTQYNNALIDDIRIYNKVLNDMEIRIIYQTTR